MLIFVIERVENYAGKGEEAGCIVYLSHKVCNFSLIHLGWDTGLLSTFFTRQILDFCKLKEIANDNLEFGENGEKFSKRVQNTVGKGEIACYEQFLLFQQYFQKIWQKNEQMLSKGSCFLALLAVSQ